MIRNGRVWRKLGCMIADDADSASGEGEHDEVDGEPAR